MSAKAPCRVDLTGGLASGKSAVAAILRRSGVPVLDADAVVHGLYQPGGAGARAVGELFGPSVLDARGGVDRDALGRLVLADSEARSRLEGLVHPLVRDEIGRWFGDRRGSEVAVVEAALLVETGSYRDYDLLLVVWCKPEQQLERAIARGVPAERARRILEAQRPLSAKRELADVVIDNGDDLAALEAEVRRCWPEVLERCRRS